MNYELKELNSSHLFSMFRLISKFGIENFKGIFTEVQGSISNDGEVDKDKLAAQLGMEIIFNVAATIISNLGNCEAETFKFLSDVSNLSVEQVSELKIDVLAEMIIDVIKKEEFKGFFSAVSKLFK
jgi:hypothetical protein